MAAVSGRVDHDHSIDGEDHVARPQITVNTGRGAAVVELAGDQSLAHSLNQGAATPTQIADLVSSPRVGEQPLLGVEAAPRRCRLHAQRLTTDIAVATPTVRRRTECLRAGRVRDGQGPAERLRGLPRRPDRRHPFQNDLLGRHVDDADDSRRTRTGVGQPAQAGRFDGEKRRIVRKSAFSERARGHEASWPRTMESPEWAGSESLAGSAETSTMGNWSRSRSSGMLNRPTPLLRNPMDAMASTLRSISQTWR